MKSDNKKDSENLSKKALRQRISLETKKEEDQYIYPDLGLVEKLLKQVRELEKTREEIHLWKTDKLGLNRPGLDEFGGNR